MTTPAAMLADLERLESQAGHAVEAFHMDEATFRAFYDRTAPALWAYLSRISGDRQLAEDLLQETYYRFLRADAPHDGEAHRRAYLFRIATNLVRDGRRRRRTQPAVDAGSEERAATAADADTPARLECRADVNRALALLKPRERALLWLAYAHGSSHREIAETLALSTASIKPLLFRARQKMAAMLRRTASASPMARDADVKGEGFSRATSVEREGLHPLAREGAEMEREGFSRAGTREREDPSEMEREGFSRAGAKGPLR